MKCTDIQIGDINSKDKPTLEQFAESAEAESSLGKSFLALTQETAWSSDYTVGAYLTDAPFQKPRLVIKHETFVRPLVIKDGTGTDLSLRGIEDAVRDHFRECKEWLQPTLSHLQGQINDLFRAREKITVDKAKAVIVAVFPEAAEATPFSTPWGRDLCAFSTGMDEGPVFVVRMLDLEPAGGVARIDCHPGYWYGLGDGVEKNKMHGLFWAELARAFAARELQIPEKDLGCEDVVATEKPWEFPQVDPYVVEKVVLRDGPGERIVVEFGSDNLPMKAELSMASREEAVGS
ncbi:MAG: hypothetical protein PHD04_04185 [Candidatus Pacebacteria bacterium]|nr:hypothetical protein [Candidatus Paceibacterota bacterium]